MFSKEIFAQRLVELRTGKKMMAKEVAETLGYSRAALSQFEKGTSAPSVATLVELADLFDVSIDYLVGRSNDPSRH